MGNVMLCYGMKILEKQPLSRRYNVCIYFTNKIILKYAWNNDKRIRPQILTSSSVDGALCIICLFVHHPFI